MKSTYNKFGIMGPNDDLVNMTILKKFFNESCHLPSLTRSPYESPYMSLEDSGVSEEFKISISQIVYVADLLYILFDGDRGVVISWMSTVHAEHVIDMCPTSIIVCGKGEPIIEWIESRLGMKPSAGF